MNAMKISLATLVIFKLQSSMQSILFLFYYFTYSLYPLSLNETLFNLIIFFKTSDRFIYYGQTECGIELLQVQ